MPRAPWVVPYVLLVGLSALAADGDRVAVVAVGQCDAASGIAARTFRSALSEKPGITVQSEADTASPFGGLTDKTLASVNSAISSARSDFYSDRAADARKTLRGALDDVARLAPSEARWVSERDALTLLAQIQLKTDKAAAESALLRIFRVEPEYRPDTSLYPPSFRRFADGIRKAAKKRSTVRFEVTTAPAGKPVYVGGKRMGAGPLTLRLPAGEYRVEADWGHRGMVRTVTVPSPPVELSAAVEGAVYPDGGPCVESTDPAVALARVAKVTGASRVHGVHTDTIDSQNYVVVTSTDAAGSDVREARVKLSEGAPSTDALGLLAGLAAGGTAASLVEVTRGPGAAAPVTAATPTSTAAAPAAAVAPTPTATAASTQSDPNATRFEAAVRAGFGIPLGDLSQAAGSMSDIDSFSIPVLGEIGARLGGHVFLGAYFSYGFGGSTNDTGCGTGYSCSPHGVLRFGAEVHWHPLGNAPTDPWVGLGSGYESISVGVTATATGASGTYSASGWEFGNLQAGLDFTVGSAVKIGPWVGFSITQYSSASVSGNGGSFGADISQKSIHEWVMGGARLVILP